MEEPKDPIVAAGRAEAAAKVTANHEVIIDDILNNSGIVRNRTSLYGGTIFAVNGYPPIPSPAVVKAVDYTLRRVATYLLTGERSAVCPLSCYAHPCAPDDAAPAKMQYTVQLVLNSQGTLLEDRSR